MARRNAGFLFYSGVGMVPRWLSWKRHMTTNGKNKNHKNGNGNGMPQRGRPCLLTDELPKAIYDDILQGASTNNACQAHGVSKQLKSQWLEKGEADFNAGQDTLHAYFYQVIYVAEGKAKSRAEKWVYAGVEGWQSNARWLERADPEWRKNLEVTGKDRGPIGVEFDVKEKLLSAINRLAARTTEAGSNSKSQPERS